MNFLPFEASVGLEAWDYGGVGRTDATTKGLAISLIPIRTRTHEWLLSYRGQELDLNRTRAVTSAAALAGFRRRHFRRLASEWELGVAEVDDQPGVPKARHVAFTVGLTLLGGGSIEQAVAEAKLERDAATTMTAIVRKRLPIGVASANWETRLKAEGGYYTRPTIARHLALALADTLAPGTTLSIEGSSSWTHPYRAPGPRTHTYRAGVILSVPVQPWVTGRVGYTFLRQTAQDRSVPLNFRRSRFVVSLTAVIP